ncbi:hypothetical protein KDX27_31565 [Burkholderia cenocepacia]|uniref:hypothetical protein n=1 Tax=Burkholderia cenocepacia TaxID=95486 RepID=UPI001BA0C1AD|nr:hypothetical protein [Burkholderia cenocepacia]MBR8172278.1 hypothetical protein [Burkholderia cenocepacia]
MESTVEALAHQIAPTHLLIVAIVIVACGAFAMIVRESMKWGAVAVATGIMMAVGVQWLKTDPATWSAWGWQAMTLAGVTFGAGIHFATQIDV